MRPPICGLCYKDFRDDTSQGGLVRFADAESLPDGMVGHPKNVEWFCGHHYDAAESLGHEPMAVAMAALGRKYRFSLIFQRLFGLLRRR